MRKRSYIEALTELRRAARAYAREVAVYRGHGQEIDTADARLREAALVYAELRRALLVAGENHDE